MLIHANAITSETRLKYDLCIIGAGPAGLALARALAPSGGRICLLEGGTLRAPTEPAARLSRGESVGRSYDQLNAGRYRRVGGASHLWNIPLEGDGVGVRLRRLDAVDFEERDWVPESGWPVRFEEMVPFYRDAHELLRLGPPCNDPDCWSESGDMRPFRFSGHRAGSTVFQFARSEAVFGELVEYVLRRTNVDLLIGSNVTSLECDESGLRIEGAVAATLEGNRFTVRATRFVLAAGGTENPRLLLASRNRHPNGLGNGHDLVGRYFMEHPHFEAGFIVPFGSSHVDRVNFYRVHMNQGVPVMAKLVLAEEVLRTERLLNWCAALRPRWEAVAPGRLRERFLTARGRFRLSAVLAELPGLVCYGFERLSHKIGGTKKTNAWRLNAMTEQIPNRDSRVTLSDQRNALGEPRVRLNWRLSELDIDSAIRVQRILACEVRRAGIGRLVTPYGREELARRIVGGWHHMGTTRMHPDPRQGVTDANGKVHGLANLYVCGSSLFPTSGYANPTLTIVALALRLAEHLSAIAVERVMIGSK